jgi:hypothetical protein
MLFPLKTEKVQYNLRTEPELMNWLKEQSVKYDRSVNFLINRAIKNLKKELENTI